MATSKGKEVNKMERVLTVKVTIDEAALAAYVAGDPTENWAGLLEDENTLIAWLNDYTATAYDDVVTLEFGE